MSRVFVLLKLTKLVKETPQGHSGAQGELSFYLLAGKKINK